MEPNEAYESVKEISNVDSLDSSVNIKANSAYGHHSYNRDPDVETTPVYCTACSGIENHDEDSHNENITSTNEAEYSYITN